MLLTREEILRTNTLGGELFLLSDYYDLSRIPFAQEIDRAKAALLRQFSIEFQEQVQALANEENAAYLSAYELYGRFQVDPETYAYDRVTVTESCFKSATARTPQLVCTRPENYIFWDDRHVSTFV